MTSLLEAGAAAPTLEKPRRTGRARTWRRVLQQPVAAGAGAVLAVVFVVGATFPRIAPADAQAINLSPHWINHAPILSGWHVLGTDQVGRDVLVRTLYGLHSSEKSALLGTLLACVLGIALGGIAGYRGGWVDSLIMRFGDMLDADCAGRHTIEIDAISTGDQRLQIFAVADIDAQRGG